MAPDSTENSPAQALPPTPKQDKAPKKPQPKKLPVGPFFSDLGLIVLEVLLPALISAGLMWFIFQNFNLWGIDHILLLVILAVGTVLFSVVMAFIIDSFTYSMRKNIRAQGVKLGSDSRMRLAKLVLGGLIIPVALFVVAITVMLPTGATAVDTAIRFAQTGGPSNPVEEIGSLVLQSSDTKIQVLGIQALAEYKTPEALAQLMRVYNERSSSLKDGSVYAALSKAIASFGVQAKKPLLDAFIQVDPAARSSSAGGDAGLFSRYFSSPFENLRGEVKAQVADLAAQEALIKQLDASEAQLQKDLAELETGSLQPIAGDVRLVFVLDTLYNMKLTGDADLLKFAKSIAADTSYSSGLRGGALRLVGQLGSKDDAAVLYPYLQSGDSVLQTHALEAISALLAKGTK
jgi:hypothetical protein